MKITEKEIAFLVCVALEVSERKKKIQAPLKQFTKGFKCKQQIRGFGNLEMDLFRCCCLKKKRGKYKSFTFRALTCLNRL